MLVSGISIFFMTLILVMYFIRKVIYISHQKHLFDEPTESRKIHIGQTPNLGGIAIFTAMMFAACITLSFTTIPYVNYLSFSCLLLFITGLTDDLVGMDPYKKIGAQFVSALTLTLFSGFRITSFYGLFGIHEIPFALSIVVSVVLIVYLVNAFNLIDGINCLAASIGLLASSILAFYFGSLHDTGFMFLCIAMSGSLIGFLYYNRTPARIFMGDTGSLFLGFFVSIIAIRFLEDSNAVSNSSLIQYSAPSLVLALLIIPVYDTLRVFIVRIANRQSPFLADRNHIHHQLLNIGLSHIQSTGILVCINMLSVAMALLMRHVVFEIFILTIFSFMLAMNWILGYLNERQRQQGKDLMEELNSVPKLTIIRDHTNILET
ncbi:MAG: MraY family glycosyltransferase [Ferruginibacter sp.]